MKLEPGMLCYIAVSPGMQKTLDGRFCTISLQGYDDLCLAFNDGRKVASWFAKFSRSFAFEGREIRGCYVAASILRPVSGPSAKPVEEPCEPEHVA